MDFMSRYDGSYRGQGRFRPHGSDESHSVIYDLFQSSEVLRHPGVVRSGARSNSLERLLDSGRC